jgi:hypothetical protein
VEHDFDACRAIPREFRAHSHSPTGNTSDDIRHALIGLAFEVQDPGACKRRACWPRPIDHQRRDATGAEHSQRI